MSVKVTYPLIVSATVVALSLAVPMKLRFATLTDVHIGESCNGDLSYEGCRPTRALTRALEKINSLDPPIDVVFMTGDLTSSALETEFQKNHDIMAQTLNESIPYVSSL